MPATTPVYSGLAPCNWARIMSWPGPRAPLRTPRISTCMDSGALPVKTVQAVPIRPRWTSLSGKKPPPMGGPEGVSGVVWAAAKVEASRSASAAQRLSAARQRQVCFRGVSTTIRVQPAGRLSHSGCYWRRLRGFTRIKRKKRLVRLKNKVRKTIIVLLVIPCKPWNKYSQPSAAKAKS